MSRGNPDIVYCEISAAGERATWLASSRMRAATHATAQNVVAGVLAVIYRRRQGGGGQLLRTSLLQGFMPYDMGQSLSLQVRPDRTQPDMSRMLPSLNYHPVRCADGNWLQLGNLLPHLFENFMRVVGLEHLLKDLPDELELVRDRILETMQSRTRDEWMALFVADGGVVAHPYLTAGETLADPDVTANGHAVTLDGVRQLGPVATLTRTPAEVTTTAKPAGGFDWRSPETTQDSRLPLSGVTVLELATIIASPLGASFLADMGARVVKVETIGGDPFRHMGGGIGATRCNQGKESISQGKESISVNLKSAEGQAIVRALAPKADILIHNYRPGVPERLGIGYQELSRDIFSAIRQDRP